MGKDFPTGDGDLAYKPSAGDDVAPFVKVIPTVPASQAERPQLRPVIPRED